jgi:Mg2+ and Co2+ transporter CorA
MERNSMLTQKNLAVSVEKVAIFHTASNTVISFFEHSADDVEVPILRRLNSPDTILRTSNDASMVVQAVIDAGVDLAIPVVAAYEDIISELEVEVLTDPEMMHSRTLYIVASELSLIRANLAPISVVISAVCDHQRSAKRDKEQREKEMRKWYFCRRRAGYATLT